MNWRAWSVRERLDKATGNHDNQVIWAFVGPGGGAAQPGAALGLLSFTTLDEWLANVEADTTHFKVEDKIRAGKPLTAIDRCLTTNGATDAQIAANIPLDSPDCPVKYQGSPRQAAGGPLSENVFKCQTKRLDFESADYAGVTFTAEQQARLAAVFPTGVCNWSKRGVDQVQRGRLDDVQGRPRRAAARRGTRLGRGLARIEAGDGGAALRHRRPYAGVGKPSIARSARSISASSSATSSSFPAR